MADDYGNQTGSGHHDDGQSGDGPRRGNSSQLEVHTGKPFRLQVKVNVPVNDHPNFNFVGKLLGPKGSSLKQLQEMTQTRMAILGRGSMRDKKKEEDLRLKGEPKYVHLNEELHVEITAFAQPAEAYRRVAGALDEIARFLVPDYADDIRQYQLNELAAMNGGRGRPKPGYGYEDPSMDSQGRPPPGAQAPSRSPAYWSSTPPTRGGAAPRRVLQPRPAASGPRRMAPASGDYSYEDPYSGYDAPAAGPRSTDYYSEQVMDEGDVNFAADDYGEPQRGSMGARSYARPRAHPYGSTSRPY